MARSHLVTLAISLAVIAVSAQAAALEVSSPFICSSNEVFECDRGTVRALRGPAAALRSAISLRIVSALMLIAVVAGCGGLPRTPVPVDHMLDAQIPVDPPGQPGRRGGTF